MSATEDQTATLHSSPEAAFLFKTRAGSGDEIEVQAQRTLARVKGKLRKNALCYNKSALNNCALCITLLLLMGSLLHIY